MIGKHLNFDTTFLPQATKKAPKIWDAPELISTTMLALFWEDLRWTYLRNLA